MNLKLGGFAEVPLSDRQLSSCLWVCSPDPFPGGSLLAGPGTKFSVRGTVITAGAGEPPAQPDFTCRAAPALPALWHFPADGKTSFTACEMTYCCKSLSLHSSGHKSCQERTSHWNPSVRGNCLHPEAKTWVSRQGRGKFVS